MTRPSAGGKSGFWSKKMARKYQWEFYVQNVISGLSSAITNSVTRVLYSKLVLKGSMGQLRRECTTTKCNETAALPPHHLPGLSGITGDIGAV
ncbi:hypothetical protein MCOR28_006045 [Pyricularia oryzae]|nr:hypothetical protein MCOR01_006706 [Pyricularia oryzae]KAI6253443.1 hypothetical protein MCOR19_010006 [Pyricularia oryzae]KAI6276270.1 hypothetical protein MCOR26_005700 [Pyricularia oryzae]KAI6341437.1 hypothetical protein MCOR28_006045 [Pyricularia oryzae]KAI6419117.1 hypothetical protein MCOR24_005179 [Pyricularia oryzae]